MVGKKHSGKADQSTLAGGGSAHAQLFSVAISWGNKMNFSLSAHVGFFAQRRNKTQRVGFRVATTCTCTHKEPIFHYKA